MTSTPAPRHSLLRSNVVVALGTALSRVTGVARLVALGYVLGRGPLSDAYNLGNSMPNIVYELLLGGILTATLVPLFVAHLDAEDDDAVSAVLTVAFIALVAITVIAVVAAPLIVELYTVFSSHDPERFRAEATVLSRWFLPQIAFYGITALATALLNARRRFTAAAFTPSLNNVLVVAALLALPHFYPGTIDLARAQNSPGLTAYLGISATLGIAAMAIPLIPAMWACGVRLRWRPHLKHPAVRELIRLSGWTIGYVAANQVALVIVLAVAEPGKGDVTAYQYAFAFFQMPHGLLAVSLMTTFAPDLAQLAARKRWRAFGARVSTGMRALALMVAPAAIGSIVLARPAVSLVLQHGSFTAEDARTTANTLIAFMAGLIGFSTYLFVLRGFYALKDTKTPFVINAVENAINIVLALLLVGRYGVVGLASAYAAAYLIMAVVAFFELRRRIGHLAVAPLVGVYVRVAISTVVMAAAIVLVTGRIEHRALHVVLGVVIGIVVYVAAIVALAPVPKQPGAGTPPRPPRTKAAPAPRPPRLVASRNRA